MPLSKVKSDHEKKYVAFGKGSGPIGQREDIDDLAIIAHQSGDKSLIELFETFPPLADLQRAKAEAQKPQQAPAPAAKPAVVEPAK